jgi:mRNA-degrading endonuclease RelE of RelBE toxin-antitoxin system
MATIEVTRLARDELRELIESRQLPADTRERVSRTLLMLEEFPRAGKRLSGVWRDCRALIGPWGWLIVVYMYIEAEDRVVVIAFHDARTSDAAIARSRRSDRPSRGY